MDVVDIAKYTLPLTSKRDYSAEYLGTLFPGGDVRNPEYTIGESIARLESVFDIGDIVYEKDPDPDTRFPAQLMPIRVVYHDGRHDPENRGILADDGFTRESFVAVLETELDIRDDEMVVIGLGFSGMGRVVGFMQPGDEAWTLRGPRYPTAFVTPKDRGEYAIVRMYTDNHGCSTDALVPLTVTEQVRYRVVQDPDRETFLRALSPYIREDSNCDGIILEKNVREIPENWRTADFNVVDITLTTPGWRQFKLPEDGRVSKYHESLSVQRRVDNEYAVSRAKVSKFRAKTATWAYVRSELMVDLPTIIHDLRVSPDFKELVITHKSHRYRSIMLAPACLMDLEDLVVMEMSPNILRCHGNAYDRLTYASELLAHRTYQDPHPEFKRELYAEQQDSLARMVALENRPGGIRGLTSARIPGIDEHLRYNGRYVRWSNDDQGTPAGGILADNPEFGKTTTIAALIATREPGIDTTVVIVPQNIVHQWDAELAACLPNEYKVSIGRPSGDPREYDVIVMTFPAFSRAYPETEWTRVVIDESHAMSPDATRFNWKTEKMWMVTRHPMDNVTGQLRAFGLPAPYSNWTRSKNLPENADIFGALSRCVIHHHHVDPNPEPVDYMPVYAKLTDTETESVRGLQARRAQITDRAMLRKIDAAIDKIEAGGMVSRDVLDAGLLLADRTRILPGTEDSCVICYEPHVDPSVTPCGHWFCRECISTALRRRSTCPMCRRPVTMGGIVLGITESESNTEPENDGQEARGGGLGGKLACRSRVDEVLRIVRGLPEGERAAIVSQSADALKLVAAELEGCSGVGGSQKQRSRAFREFDRALVINTRSMCTGLNLSRANNLVIMGRVSDIEMVLDTVARPGQTKPVQVYHILLRDPM